MEEQEVVIVTNSQEIYESLSGNQEIKDTSDETGIPVTIILIAKEEEK